MTRHVMEYLIGCVSTSLAGYQLAEDQPPAPTLFSAHVPVQLGHTLGDWGWVSVVDATMGMCMCAVALCGLI